MGMGARGGGGVGRRALRTEVAVESEAANAAGRLAELAPVKWDVFISARDLTLYDARSMVRFRNGLIGCAGR